MRHLKQLLLAAVVAVTFSGGAEARFGHGGFTIVPANWNVPPPPVVKPVVPPSTVAPPSTPTTPPPAGGSKGGWQHAAGAAVFVGVATFFLLAIAEHDRCRREKRGCYEHVPE